MNKPVNIQSTQNFSISCTQSKQIEQPNNLLGMKTAEISAIGALLTTALSLIVAFSTIYKYSVDIRHQQKINDQDKKRRQADDARDKIEKFYGPCSALLEESSIIYSHFALKEKMELQSQGEYFRTLRYLTLNNGQDDDKKLLPHDEELLNQIVIISGKIIVLVEQQSGLVENPELHKLLGKLCAHYRMVELASKGRLKNQSEHLEDIVFPLEINGAIENEIRKLQNIINPPPKKNIPKSKTIAYYNKKPFEYYQQTYFVDMSDVYKKVRKHIKNGGNILDAGCGVGRDTEYFIKHGFKVTSFDASSEMVELCNQYYFAYCELNDFNKINYPAKFDLVWACASLLHLSGIDFKDALYRLHKATKHEGILYFSLKKTMKNNHDGRDFYLIDQNTIDRICIGELRMRKLEQWEIKSGVIGSTEVFINYIYKKE